MPIETPSLTAWSPQNFVANSGWRFARTMPDQPHWYTVRDLEHPDRSTCESTASFEAFVAHVRAVGIDQQWGSRLYRYLRLDDYEYWTMGYPVAETTIINRRHAAGR